jgi:hypothetical protein
MTEWCLPVRQKTLFKCDRCEGETTNLGNQGSPRCLRKSSRKRVRRTRRRLDRLTSPATLRGTRARSAEQRLQWLVQSPGQGPPQDGQCVIPPCLNSERSSEAAAQNQTCDLSHSKRPAPSPSNHRGHTESVKPMVLLISCLPQVVQHRSSNKPREAIQGCLKVLWWAQRRNRGERDLYAHLKGEKRNCFALVPLR